MLWYFHANIIPLRAHVCIQINFVFNDILPITFLMIFLQYENYTNSLKVDFVNLHLVNVWPGKYSRGGFICYVCWLVSCTRKLCRTILNFLVIICDRTRWKSESLSFPCQSTKTKRDTMIDSAMNYACSLIWITTCIQSILNNPRRLAIPRTMTMYFYARWLKLYLINCFDEAYNYYYEIKMFFVGYT